MPFGTKIRFEPRTPVEAALVAEFEYAAAQIDRLRRAQEDALERLMAQGLDETGALGCRRDTKPRGATK